MYRKCYPVIAALFGDKEVDQAAFSEKWRFFRDFRGRLKIMVRNTNGVVSYAPLYIHSFRLLQSCKLANAEKFKIDCSDPARLTSTADKLRWYRYAKGLHQREVAEYAGIDRSTYISYENGLDYYPPDKLRLLAELFGVDVFELADEYNTFLLNGQGEQILSLRKSLNMTQMEFANALGVYPDTVAKWERDRARMFKSTWERVMAMVGGDQYKKAGSGQE